MSELKSVIELAKQHEDRRAEERSLEGISSPLIFNGLNEEGRARFYRSLVTESHIPWDYHFTKSLGEVVEKVFEQIAAPEEKNRYVFPAYVQALEAFDEQAAVSSQDSVKKLLHRVSKAAHAALA